MMSARSETSPEPSERAPGAILDEVEAAVCPVLRAEGYDLVLAELHRGSRILRLFIDKLDAQAGGVSIDDCSRVSRLVGDLLDGEGLTDRVADACGGSFNLEVSSPGLDRPLARPCDFLRFVGREVRITTRAALDGRRKFRGQLLGADEVVDERRAVAQVTEGKIRVEVDGRQIDIPYDLIDKARLIPEL